MMTRFLVPTIALAVVALGAACGDLSEEDLIFRGAVPAKAELELQPAGEASTANQPDDTQSQALGNRCADGDLRCNARDAARGFNGLTFQLLDLIDRITAQPPTTRATGVRVWGPYFDLKSLSTARFEMTRNDDGQSFSFCVHAVRGTIRNAQARDITCATDVDADTGLHEILSGSFTPSNVVGDGARKGRGELVLRTDRIPDFSALHAQQIHIQFDNTDSKKDVSLQIVGVVGADGTVLPSPLQYHFRRGDDGSGSLSFVVIGDVAADVPGLETATIDARWASDQSGRAVASVTTSDGDKGFFEDQCWDRHVGTVYAHVVVEPGDGTSSTEVQNGHEDQCAFECADLSGIAADDDNDDPVASCNKAP